MQDTLTQIQVKPWPVRNEAQSAYLVMEQPTLIASFVQMVTFFSLKIILRVSKLDLMAISVKHKDVKHVISAVWHVSVQAMNYERLALT